MFAIDMLSFTSDILVGRQLYLILVPTITWDFLRTRAHVQRKWKRR